MYRIISSAILLLGLCCISNNVLAQAQAAQDQQKQLKDDPILYITAGYSSDEQMATGYRCVIQDPSLFSFQGGSKSVINLGDERDFNQFQQDLNVNISTSGGYGMFSGSADASYARQVEDDNYSEDFYYDEIIQLPTEIYTPTAFGPQMLNSYGQQAEQADATGQIFRTYCGDQYVMQTPLGARLMVTFKLNFASQKDRETFSANIGGGMGSIFSASAAVSNVVSQYNLHGSLSVYALQDGGDATQLAKIFGSPTCGGHYCVSTCDLNNLTYCQGIIDGIINYAANEFPPQIDFDDGQIKGSAIPLSFTMGSYPGVKVGASLVTPDVVQARVALGNLYTQQIAPLTFINHFIDDSAVVSHLSADYAARLTTMQQLLNNNVYILTNSATGAPACYQTPDQCMSIYNQLINQVKPIDQQLYGRISEMYYVKEYQPNYQPDYYIIPISDTSYAKFHVENMAWAANQSMTPTADGGFDINGIDGVDATFYGHMVKQPDGTYSGTCHYSDGRNNQQVYNLVPNDL